MNMGRPSTNKIDVLIPAVEKDLGTLPHVIDAVRKQVRHRVGQIFIVAPRRRRILALCRRKRCKFVDENTVLPIQKRHIRYRSRKWERSGWLYQQLLKLNGDTLGTAPDFLVIDADTVLIRPHVFKQGNKTVFYCRNWSQPEYFRTYRRLMGRKATAPVSFVTHYMLFNKAKLRLLKRQIEARHRTRWYTAILRAMDKSKPFAFSEFETYGNFLYTQNPRGVLLKKALNKSLTTNIENLTRQKLKALARKYRSISFHKRRVYRRGTGAIKR